MKYYFANYSSIFSLDLDNIVNDLYLHVYIIPFLILKNLIFCIIMLFYLMLD